MITVAGRRAARAAALVVSVVVVGACSGVPSSDPATTTPSDTEQSDAADGPGEQPFPEIVKATVVARSDTLFDVQVTVSSAYDTPERYADGWRVLTPDGTVLGSHTLLHHHGAEQPFTRLMSGLTIPEGVRTVVVEGRDLVNGYGGVTVEVAVPGR